MVGFASRRSMGSTNLWKAMTGSKYLFEREITTSEACRDGYPWLTYGASESVNAWARYR